MSDRDVDRRAFLKHSVSGAAGLSLGSALIANAHGANDRIRIGLIGCGGRGNFLIQQALRHRQEFKVEIGAICDVWRLNLETTAAAVREAQGRAPRTFRRYGDLLARRDIDAVIVATPDFAHTPILIDAVRAGKDAFVEKPMATVLEQANEAVRVVEASDRIVQIGNQRRSDVRHQNAARFVQSGALGKISEVETAWHDNAPRWGNRDTSNVHEADVDWEGYLMYLPREPFSAARFKRWHLYKSFTVGTPALLGAHLIDVGCWFMDDPLPVSAVAHGGIYVWKDGREHADTMECLIEYPKGFLLKYSTRFGNNRPTPEAIFYGTKGTFDTQSWTARGDAGGSDLSGAPNANLLQTPVTIPEPPRAPAPEPRATGTPDPRIQNDDHMINWLECLRSRRRPTAPVEIGYSHTVASIMCFEAWQTGRRQAFDAATRTIRAG